MIIHAHYRALIRPKPDLGDAFFCLWLDVRDKADSSGKPQGPVA
jgi:hypothetical protein